MTKYYVKTEFTRRVYTSEGESKEYTVLDLGVPFEDIEDAEDEIIQCFDGGFDKVELVVVEEDVD